jgi:hypothetical protein
MKGKIEKWLLKRKQRKTSKALNSHLPNVHIYLKINNPITMTCPNSLTVEGL